MEIALGQLKEQRALLQLPIDAHLALISSMRRIPQDVLLEIFLACLPTEHNALIDFDEALLVLGRIRHWRQLAYSTLMLWNSIHIPALNYSLTPPGILLRFKSIAKSWLERSALCPLSVQSSSCDSNIP
ncbi:F-box domain-containing protein [Mycena sanguinolenta]|uniref:F-box domain-containing protein n=1 Tax=Mycena sanguinolenta TaxID=230812 RepID=A0A8H6XXL1_9AGAR|nr:F-box domain-containing protein [Mycena sanguinolenta]